VNRYKRLNKGYYVFVYNNGTVVAIYVNDILILTSYKSSIRLLK